MTFGIDILNTEAIVKHPYRQAGAAILDGLTGYGIYLLADNANAFGGDDGDRDSTSESTTSGGDTINIEGDGNTVNTGDTTVPVPTPSS